MLETRATVVQIHAGTALVLANQVSGCEQCNGQGCGSSKVAQLFCSNPRKFEVQNPIGAVVGDEVIVALADGAVMRGIGLVYLVPLILLVLGAGLGSLLSMQPEQVDLDVSLGGFVGLLLGFIAVKWLSAKADRRRSQPYIAKHWVG